ncbi:MAG: response regulator [Elusimicrobia bacterium]|nr:response regulator [Elusimicrobiota bacterium]
MIMLNTILLADDDQGVAATVGRLLGGDCRLIVARDGLEAVAAAEAGNPDLILLDVHMPGLNGWEVLEHLRHEARTRTTPVIMLTGCTDEQAKDDGFGLGADDYVTKPFSARDLRARVFSRLHRHAEAVAVNPLTRLPGSPSIQAEVESRIRGGRPFGFLLADIDRFKAFNDYYGCERGDRVLLRTGELLREAMREAGEAHGFLGHIGGDDFALVCEAEKAPLVAAFATMKFDEAVPGLYDAADAARGFIEIEDRSGAFKAHAPLSLSVAGVSSAQRPILSYADAVRWAGEMKRWLKSTRDSGPSALAFDRRRGGI